MTEPTYEYVKGKGWQPQAQAQGPWYVAFKTPESNWVNATASGVSYKTREEAQRAYRRFVNDFKRYIVNDGWQFEVTNKEP